jgi:hypothetical protein
MTDIKKWDSSNGRWATQAELSEHEPFGKINLEIRKDYDSDETDILETYTHRLQDKIHISYLPGAFGDFVIGGIFLSLGQTKEKILKRADSEILDTGAIAVQPQDYYNNNNTFKCDNIIDYSKISTRLQFLASVYHSLHHPDRVDLDYKITIPDDGSKPIDRIPVIQTHLYVELPQLINCMQKEFNQKLILIKAITDEDKLLADYMHQLKAYNMPVSELVDDIVGRTQIMDTNMSLVEAENKDALVVSTSDFINHADVFRECLRNILEFSEAEYDESILDGIVQFRNKWFWKQNIKEINKKIDEYRNTLAINKKIEEDRKLLKKVGDFNHYNGVDKTRKPFVALASKNVNNFTIFGNTDIVACNESKSIIVRHLSMFGRVNELLVILDATLDLHKWELHIDETEESLISVSIFPKLSSIVPRFKSVYLYTGDVNLESNLKILNLPGILFGESIPYMLLDRTLRRRNDERISISTDTTSHDTKKFIFQNNRVRNERTAIMNKIFEHNIENEFHLSWLIQDGIIDIDDDIFKLHFDPTVKMILDAENLTRDLIAQDDISPYYNTALIDIFSESIPKTNTSLHIKDFVLSQLSIHVLFPTEKTWKPICAGKPFLGFGTAHYYKWLKSEGWETYDNIFDYSFDEIEDDRERLDTWFKDNILRLSKMSIEQIQSLIKLDADKIERNKNKALCYKLEIPDRLSHFISSDYFGIIK